MLVHPEFAEFKKKYDKRVPQVVWTTLVADLETPVSAMLKLADGRPYSFLLESVEGGATSVVGFADYEVRGNVAVMPHTVISSDRRGHGLGDVLVGAAVQELRDRGLTIDPVCWFVADYLERHPSQH